MFAEDVSFHLGLALIKKSLILAKQYHFAALDGQQQHLGQYELIKSAAIAGIQNISDAKSEMQTNILLSIP